VRHLRVDLRNGAYIAAVAEASEPTIDRPKTSTRDRDSLRRGLQRWLHAHHEAGDRATIVEFDAPSTNGMSSETILVTVDGAATAGRERLVVRLSPDTAAVPVFPVYDLEKQFRVMQLVGERTDVPVPTMRWYEPSGEWLGAPFLVMDHVDGRVPPDMMPYVFGSWLTEATPAERGSLQRATIETLARLHALPVGPHTEFLHYDVPGDSPLRRHVEDQRRFYEWVVADGVRSPLIERTFGWLDEHWPVEGETVISWGDSRIGNILYRGFDPVAVLDWEMVGLATREVDLAWLVSMHRSFQEIAQRAGVPGLPDFLRRADVAATYHELTGHEPVDMQWYETYAALRFAIIMFRITRRAVHFGEATMPADPDDAISHRALLERMLAGTHVP
jgi:aminoglycoside phosphotransferase (APT) family kinase protein